MWTDFQAWSVFALGDALMFSAMVYLAACFVLALLVATTYTIRNLRP